MQLKKSNHMIGGGNIIYLRCEMHINISIALVLLIQESKDMEDNFIKKLKMKPKKYFCLYHLQKKLLIKKLICKHIMMQMELI